MDHVDLQVGSDWRCSLATSRPGADTAGRLGHSRRVIGIALTAGTRGARSTRCACPPRPAVHAAPQRAPAAAPWPARRTGRTPTDFEMRKRGLERGPAGEREILTTRNAGRHPLGCGVQPGEQRPHPAPVLGALELAVLGRDPGGERLHTDRIPLVEAAQNRSAGRRERRQDELQSGLVSQRGRGAIRPVERGEDVVRAPACVPPRSQVVGAHEPSRPTCVGRLPVVAAEPDRQVVQARRGDAPMALERVRQRRSVEIPRLAVHADTIGGRQHVVRSA